MESSTRLAYSRTVLAHERTQLAWVRTCLALISFGFGIAKFYQYLHESVPAHAPVFGPKLVGMVMIGIGLGAMALAALQHHRALQALREECPDLPRSAAGATAVVVVLIGIAAFVIALR